jgi:chemotaxis-related protein WspB
MLLFYVSDNCYAVDSQYIVRVLPWVNLNKSSSTPNYVAGLLNFGGKTIPIVDFCQLIERRATPLLISSKIILVKDPKSIDEHIWGILGEKVTDLLDVRREEFQQKDFSGSSFPYINRIYNNDQQIIQYLDIEEFFRFLPQEKNAAKD